jgi:polyisoprenoid-binding protein YceI
MAWVIDNAHSEVQFSVRHMMISNVRGRFESFKGTVYFNEAEPEKSTVDVQIDAASLNTRDPNRDNHLRSPDFLDVAQFPTINFQCKRVEKVDDTHGRIIGDLTIRNVSHEVVLDTEYAGQSKSPWGSISAGFSATTKFNRKDWGLTWNQNLETGGLLVGDIVTVSIELEVVKQPEAETVAAA